MSWLPPKKFRGNVKGREATYVLDRNSQGAVCLPFDPVEGEESMRLGWHHAGDRLKGLCGTRCVLLSESRVGRPSFCEGAAPLDRTWPPRPWCLWCHGHAAPSRRPPRNQTLEETSHQQLQWRKSEYLVLTWRNKCFHDGLEQRTHLRAVWQGKMEL